MARSAKTSAASRATDDNSPPAAAKKARARRGATPATSAEAPAPAPRKRKAPAAAVEHAPELAFEPAPPAPVAPPPPPPAPPPPPLAPPPAPVFHPEPVVERPRETPPPAPVFTAPPEPLVERPIFTPQPEAPRPPTPSDDADIPRSFSASPDDEPAPREEPSHTDRGGDRDVRFDARDDRRSRHDEARPGAGGGPAPTDARSAGDAPDGRSAQSGSDLPPAPGSPPRDHPPGQGRGPHERPAQGQGNQGGNGQPQDRGNGGGQGGGGDNRDNLPPWKRDRGDRHGGKHGKHDKHAGKPWKQNGPGGPGGAPDGRPPRHPPQPPPPNLSTPLGDLPDPARFQDLAALEARATELLASPGTPLRIEVLYALHLHALTAEARRLGVTFEGQPGRLQLLEAIFKHAAATKLPIFDHGWLDLTDRGHGFIVHQHVNYRLYPEDSYVPESLIRRYGLKRGHEIEAVIAAPEGGDRCPAAVRIVKVMSDAPEKAIAVTPFEELTPYYPLQRILLEANEIHKDISMRVVDLLTPVGFGQRGLIVAPPRTGKTVLLQNIANSIAHNFPEKRLLVLLIDERPEEVTDFLRHTKGEVVSSTFDETPESHVHCAEMVIERARRHVELGEHVVILLDSITRLARAYNALAGSGGKTMSGGLESNALQKPKRFFGSARNIEGAGSLTILATALIDTGSRMDEIIFEEFKGTGNMELHLDRGLSDKRIFPAINVDRSGTRKEELIYHPDEMQRVYGLRRAMQGIPAVESMDMLIQRLKKTKSNAEFLMSLR